jgi:hypothetical protein
MLRHGSGGRPRRREPARTLRIVASKIVMHEEIADAVLDKVKHFTIGFALAGDTPAAKGSGVLIKHGQLHGILTCAHVDKCLRELKRPVGLVRLNRGLTQQSGILDMDGINSYVAGAEPWANGDEDIAFIHLPPHFVGNITKDCVFIDAEQNFAKPQPGDYSALIQVHSAFGLVEQFTGATTRQSGRATTLLKGSLTSGVLRDFGALTVTLECFEENIPDLPNSFGGTSGGGLWRVYVRRQQDGSYEAVHHRLIGIASREDQGSPPRITCQGMGRIEMILNNVGRSMSENS